MAASLSHHQPVAPLSTCAYMIPGTNPLHIATCQIDWSADRVAAREFYDGIATLGLRPPTLLNGIGDAAELVQLSDGTFLVALQGDAVIQIGMSNPTVAALERAARSVLARVAAATPPG